MKDPKFGYHWVWLIPYYVVYNSYLSVLQKWFPKKFKKALETK